ncbi:MAG: ABC transporter ATP-binding protein [Erythrobacter sp.]|jgi:ABC-type polysaccharide/polyol phosphate transport system ATPase subunit|nr:ABC transporter ATP-binding protein [Erythrobacter sp.]
MITVDHISKDYRTRTGPRRVLDNVSFTLERRERLGVLGRNGAGKSTLIRLVSGAERPTSGRITRGMSVSWPLAFGGAFQAQLTGVDNVRFISRLYAQDPEHNLAFIEEFAELGQYLREPVMTYSSGMRARLAFAISMIIEFDCFLIDEIASVGDARFHERCNYELFDKRGDRAMMIISHDPGYLRDHCNRFAVLDAGRLTAFDDFETAHDHFLAQMRVGGPVRVVAQPFSRRMAAIDSLRRVAHEDEHFMALVRQADAARDRHDWAAAEASYAAALSLHPYERSYWVQLGHVTREQGRMVRAEIAYRTACAFGESVHVLEPFIAAVEQPGKAAPAIPVAAPDGGETRRQPPGYPDLAVLAALAQGRDRLGDDEALALMRRQDGIEDVLAHMLDDPSTTASGAALPGGIAVVPGDAPLRIEWREDLARLAGARQEELDAALARGDEPFHALRRSGGLDGWAVPAASRAEASA